MRRSKAQIVLDDVPVRAPFDTKKSACFGLGGYHQSEKCEHRLGQTGAAGIDDRRQRDVTHGA
jgi:hypothetical protein